MEKKIYKAVNSTSLFDKIMNFAYKVEKINKKIEEKVHFIGMIFLLVLMLIIVFFDVTKYF